jgi:hypothetical protein
MTIGFFNSRFSVDRIEDFFARTRIEMSPTYSFRVAFVRRISL